MSRDPSLEAALAENRRLRARLAELEPRGGWASSSTEGPPIPAGAEVSMRAIASVIDVFAERRVPLERLVAGTGVKPESLRDSDCWISWETLCALLDNAEREIGADGLRRAGHIGLEHPAVRVFQVVGWLMRSELALVQWVGAQTFGPGSLVYRNLELEARQPSSELLVLRVRDRQGRSFPRAFIDQLGPAAAMAPTLIGRREATWDARQTDGELILELRLEPRRLDRARATARHAIAKLLVGDALEETRIAYEALRERTIELDSRLEALRQSEQRRQDLESRLRQAQKMEAIGRLAGGVAHDFNNLLTVILSHADFLHDDLGDSEDVSRIVEAAERAAKLTGQLLAFGRQQVLELRVIDLNAIVRGLDAILRSLTGSSVAVEQILTDDLGRVRADRSQLEQVLLNLVVNARDAMPDGGRLTIETANVTFDESYVAEHPQTRPGPHVMLAVSDTGVGMDPETKSHIFEPFFTTKSEGRGTGLGLAMVYGIVRQLGGTIWVYSEIGHGTSFRAYLPRVDAPLDVDTRAKALRAPQETQHTVLVVEDEKPVRDVTCRMLRQFGYVVLEAANADAALALAAGHEGVIDVLLSDIVMPGRSGRELASAILETRPDTRVLFMSGYTNNGLVRDGRLAPGQAFVQKPFSTGDLRAALEALLAG